jgi:hypothetical protein
VYETGGADKVYAVDAHDPYACGKMAGRLLDRLRGYFRGYIKSFERGRRKFGVWWVVFTGAMILVIVILLAFAIGLYFFVLPGFRVL